MVVNFEKGFLAVFVYENSLRFCGVRAVIALNIEAFVAAFNVGTFVTAVNAFFGTAGHVRAFFIGRAGRKRADAIFRPTAAAPFTQEAVIAGKSAVGNGVNAFTREFAKLVFYAEHCLNVHYPMSAERHFYQSADILSAPIVDKPN